MAPLQVLVVSRRPLVADSLLALLAQRADMRAFGLPFPAPPAWPSLAVPPRVMLVDVWNVMTRAEWMDLCANPWSAPVIAIACCPRVDTPSLAALNACVPGYVLMQDTADVLVQAIRTVARGGTFMVGDRWPSHAKRPLHALGREKTISAEEAQVIQRLIDGLSDEEIGQRLYRSKHTIKHMVDGVRERLGFRNRMLLAVWALASGLAWPTALRGDLFTPFGQCELAPHPPRGGSPPALALSLPDVGARRGRA